MDFDIRTADGDLIVLVYILALTKHDLDPMMHVCYEYSRKWRYTLNPSKSCCSCIWRIGKTQKSLMYQRNWKRDTDSVHERTTHPHVGLILSTTANNTERTLQATKLIRNTFFSLVGSGLHPSNINPLSIVKTFQSVCLQRGLYGCELWSNIQLAKYIC